jgi:hypothetical protein
MKGRSWRTDYPLVQAACHKLGQGDRVCSLHELSKSANVSEGIQSTIKSYIAKCSYFKVMKVGKL